MSSLIDLVGFVPAIIFPAAGLVQLATIIKRKEAGGVPVLTWSMVGVANVCLYVYTQKYGDLLTIFATLGAGASNFAVALTASWLQHKEANRPK